MVIIVKDTKNTAEKNSSNTFLFDTGVSENGVIHNADIFGIDFKQIDGIILSHGHFDHFAGLVNILKRMSPSSRRTTTTSTNHVIDIFTHPDAFLRRWEIYPDGKRAKSPFRDERHLQELGAIIRKLLMLDFFPAKSLLYY